MTCPKRPAVPAPGADPVYVHLRIGPAPVTACGKTVESPVRWDWDVPDAAVVGKLRVDEVTCLECIAAAGLMPDVVIAAARLEKEKGDLRAAYLAVSAKNAAAEAEIARLKRELDECEREIDAMDRRRADEWSRAEDAEAEAARLAENKMVRYERGDDFLHHFWKERAEAAEAEGARLRDGLRRIAKQTPFQVRNPTPESIARALLGEDGAA